MSAGLSSSGWQQNIFLKVKVASNASSICCQQRQKQEQGPEARHAEFMEPKHMYVEVGSVSWYWRELWRKTCGYSDTFRNLTALYIAHGLHAALSLLHSKQGSQYGGLLPAAVLLVSVICMGDGRIA